jgi:hypothetical protein
LMSACDYTSLLFHHFSRNRNMPPSLHHELRARLAAFIVALIVLAAPWHKACAANADQLTPLSVQQCQAMLQANTLRADNPLPCARLTQVVFSYEGFDGQRHDDGKLVVMDAVAPQVQAIFAELLARRFPLQQARPLENFQGDDQASMLGNNTSAFNGRAITGSSGWSKHAYGVAIDINPRQNPYLSRAADQPPVLLPATATDYLRRTPLRPGMAESVRGIFFRHGFMIWGGNWHQPIDYQHFEIGSRALIAELLALPPAAARQAFADYAQRYRDCMHDSQQQHSAQAARSDACARQSKR